MHSIKINNFEISNTKPFTLIAGPCVIENREHAIKMAKYIDEICKNIDLNLSIIISQFFVKGEVAFPQYLLVRS